MKGYKYNTIELVNDAIQQVNTDNNFTPIEGNTTQTLISSELSIYGNETFYLIRANSICVNSLGQPTEIQVDEPTLGEPT
jgi:hypothetical protein